MLTKFKHVLLITLGWFFIVLAVIGAILPLLPATPFIILASACFAKSSPRFHRMLLTNKWFGPSLTQWEETKTIRREIKHKIMLIMIVSFGASTILFTGKVVIQVTLVLTCIVLLIFISQLKELEK